MKKVYICSPYRAHSSAELDRNIEYVQEITRQVLRAGYAPITPHLYMTQCLNENDPEERSIGMAAGLQLLAGCDFVVIGDRYGISEGMDTEMRLAEELGIELVKADEVHGGEVNEGSR